MHASAKQSLLNEAALQNQNYDDFSLRSITRKNFIEHLKQSKAREPKR